MPDLSTDDQRWQIMELFEGFGIRDLRWMKETAAQILKLDAVTDLREITKADADELIAELIRAKTQGKIGRD